MPTPISGVHVYLVGTTEQVGRLRQVEEGRGDVEERRVRVSDGDERDERAGRRERIM